VCVTFFEKFKEFSTPQVAFPCRTSDETYLPALAAALERAFKAFTPDFVLYNAGTDILVGDPLGACAPAQRADRRQACALSRRLH